MDIKKGLSLLDDASYGITIMETNFKVKWANKYILSRFGYDIIGKQCFRYSKSFNQPCDWCPAKLVLIDKGLHIAISPSIPKTEPDEKRILCQIASLPYEFNTDGSVKTIIEFAFEATTAQEDEYSRYTSFYNFSLKCLEVLQISEADCIATIILYCLVAPGGSEFDEAELFFLSEKSDKMTVNVEKAMSLCKNNILPEDVTCFNSLNNNSEMISKFVGRIKARATFRKLDIPLVVALGRSGLDIFKHNRPIRIDTRQVAVPLFSDNEGFYAVLVVRNRKTNSWLLEKDLMDFAVFLTGIKTAFQARNAISKMKQSVDNVERFLSGASEASVLVNAIPFAIGKTHDISQIYLRVKGTFNMLRDMINLKKDETSKKIIADMDISLKSIQRLMESMASINKLTMPSFENIYIKDVLTSAADKFSLDYQSGKISININSKQAPDKVYIDPLLVEHVFMNLIDNSIRAFRPVKRSEKVISVCARIIDSNLHIEYTDNATGISPDIQGLVWERGYSTKSKGTGLGMYFAKYIVENVHGGTIKLQSEYGASTTFLINIPIVKR